MSHVADRSLLQDATIWRVTPDGFGGDTYSAPVAIKCRWEDRKEVFFSVLDSKEQVSKAVVNVNTNASVGDWIVLGTSVAANPSIIGGAYKIRRFDNIPSLRQLFMVKKAFL